MEALTADYYEAVSNPDLVHDESTKVAAGVHKVVVSEDMEAEEMNHLTSAQIPCIALVVRQERPKTRWHCGLWRYRNMKAQIESRAGFDCLSLGKVGKETEA